MSRPCLVIIMLCRSRYVTPPPPQCIYNGKKTAWNFSEINIYVGALCNYALTLLSKNCNPKACAGEKGPRCTGLEALSAWLARFAFVLSSALKLWQS